MDSLETIDPVALPSTEQVVVTPPESGEGSRMKMLRRALLGLWSVVLLGVAGAAVALPPRVSWVPAQLVTESIAPGEQATYSVVFKNTGWLPIPVGQQLQIVAEGDIAPYITIAQPAFPKGAFRRGQEVSFDVTVAVPADAPVGVSEGKLVLKRVVGKYVVDVWRAEALPVSVDVVEEEIGTTLLNNSGISVSYPSTWQADGDGDGYLSLYSPEVSGGDFSPPSVFIEMVPDTTLAAYENEEHLRAYAERTPIVVSGHAGVFLDDRSSEYPSRPFALVLVDASPDVLVVTAEYTSFEDFMLILNTIVIP